ncbi:hypothetical protein Tco_0226440 [Tanacetum coccineum]
MKRKKVTKSDGNISDDIADYNEQKLSTDGYFASSTGMNQHPFAQGLENTHLTRNVRPRLSTANSDIRASTTMDGTITPVSRIFDRSVRRRLTTGAAIVYANVSSAPSSDGHHLDTDVFRNRRMTDDSQTMLLGQITVETTIPVQLEYADASSNTCTQTSANFRLAVGHQHVASKPVPNEVSAANESVATYTHKWKKSQPLAASEVKEDSPSRSIRRRAIPASSRKRPVNVIGSNQNVNN